MCGPYYQIANENQGECLPGFESEQYRIQIGIERGKLLVDSPKAIHCIIFSD